MATLAEAHDKLAEVFKTTPSAVKLIGLQLLDHGLRTKTYRGPSSPQLGTRDITNYSIALVCRLGPREAPHIVKTISEFEIGKLKVWDVDAHDHVIPSSLSEEFSAPSLVRNKEGLLAKMHAGTPVGRLPVAHTFGESFQKLIEVLGTEDGEEFRNTEVVIDFFQNRASISFTIREKLYEVHFGISPNFSIGDAVYARFGMRGSVLTKLASLAVPHALDGAQP